MEEGEQDQAKRSTGEYSRFFERPKPARDKPEGVIPPTVGQTAKTPSLEKSAMERLRTADLPIRRRAQSTVAASTSAMRLRQFINLTDDDMNLRIAELRRAVSDDRTAIDKAVAEHQRSHLAGTTNNNAPRFGVTPSPSVIADLIPRRAERKRARGSMGQLIADLQHAGGTVIDEQDRRIAAKEQPTAQDRPTKRPFAPGSANFDLQNREYFDPSLVPEPLCVRRPLNNSNNNSDLTPEERALKAKQFQKWLQTQIPKHHLPPEARMYLQKQGAARLVIACVKGVAVQELRIGPSCLPTWPGDVWDSEEEDLHTVLQRHLSAKEYSASLSETLEKEVIQKGNLRLTEAVSLGVKLEQLYIGDDLLPNWMGEDSPDALNISPSYQSDKLRSMAVEEDEHPEKAVESLPEGHASGSLTLGRSSSYTLGRFSSGIIGRCSDPLGHSSSHTWGRPNEDAASDDTSNYHSKGVSSELDYLTEEGEPHSEAGACGHSSEPQNIVHDVEVNGQAVDMEVYVANSDDSCSDLMSLSNAEFVLYDASDIFEGEDAQEMIDIEVEGMNLELRDPVSTDEVAEEVEETRPHAVAPKAVMDGDGAVVLEPPREFLEGEDEIEMAGDGGDGEDDANASDESEEL